MMVQPGNRDSHEPLSHSALKRLSDAVISVNTTFECTFLNPAAEQLFDVTVEAVRGQHIRTVLPTAAGVSVEEHLHTASQSGQTETFEWHDETHDRWFEVSVHPGDDGLTLLVSDISERKADEQELVTKNRLLDALFEFVPVHIFVKDDEFRHLWMSSALVDDPSRYIGKRDTDLETGAEDEFSAEAVADDRRVVEDQHRIIDKEEYNERLDKWFLTSKVPWFDDDGSVAGLLGYSVDITERKEHERQLQQQHDRLDEFASVISHDLRNPLGIAQGRAQMLDDNFDSEHLPPMIDAIDRMDEIISGTLTLARQGAVVSDTEPISVPVFVNSCWASVATDKATIECEDQFTITGDPERLKHVFENLFRNAVEHGGRDITVTVGRIDDTGIYVADSGPGIPAERRENIFDAGYTSTDSGTGFGLAIVQRVAEAHGWEVTVTDATQGGARFEFTGVDVES